MPNEFQLILMRQSAMNWAMQTSPMGESHTAVLERAEAYLAFLSVPIAAGATNHQGFAHPPTAEMH